MNFMGLIKRTDKTDRVFEELEEVMEDAIDENLLVDDAPPLEPSEVPLEGLGSDEDDLLSELDLQPDESMLDIAEDDFAEAAEVEAGRRLTTHTQNRLAALASFDELYRDAQGYLREINEKLSEVTSSHHLTREFFNLVHADIQRANELELANAELGLQNRKKADQIHELSRRMQEQEARLEILEGREAGLMQDKDTLRSALSATRLELVEATNVIARNEAELGDVIRMLSTRTVEAERRSRETEVLREKQVSLSIDLDNAMKQEAESRRKLDEVVTIQSNETARYAELIATLAKSEKELMRLQKSNEVAQARHGELADQARNAEAEREAEGQRAAAEIHGLKSEMQALQSRLDRTAKEQVDLTGEMSKLKVQLNDAVAEKQVADEKLAALKREAKADKQNLSAASANISQLSLQQASEQMQLDIHKQECEDLRTEIAALNDRIKELLPYERLYRVAKTRQRDSGPNVPEIGAVGVISEAQRTATRRSNGTGRRRA